MPGSSEQDECRKHYQVGDGGRTEIAEPTRHPRGTVNARYTPHRRRNWHHHTCHRMLPTPQVKIDEREAAPYLRSKLEGEKLAGRDSQEAKRAPAASGAYTYTPTSSCTSTHSVCIALQHQRCGIQGQTARLKTCHLTNQQIKPSMCGGSRTVFVHRGVRWCRRRGEKFATCILLREVRGGGINVVPGCIGYWRRRRLRRHRKVLKDGEGEPVLVFTSQESGSRTCSVGDATVVTARAEFSVVTTADAARALPARNAGRQCLKTGKIRNGQGL